MQAHSDNAAGSAVQKNNLMQIPVLETARLRLREHRKEDFDRSFEMWTAPETVRFTTGKPSTKQQAWARLMNYRGHWQLMGFGYWAVEEKSSGLFIGDIGFADFKRDVQPSIEGLPELGWGLMPAFHGRGYATEALLAAYAWAEGHFVQPIDRCVCMIDPANLASVRVAEKTGFKEYARTTYNDAASILFERRF